MRRATTAESGVRTVSFCSAGAVTLGVSSCRPEDPNFRLGGKLGRVCLAFPKRSLWIEPEHHRAFVADTTKITLYGAHDEFERRAIDPDGGHAEWITFSDAIVHEVLTGLQVRGREDALRFPQPYVSATSGALYLSQRYLFDHVQYSGPDYLYIEEASVTVLATAMAALYGSERRLSQDYSHHKLVQDTCAYLNRTFRDNETLNVVASAVGASVFHLCRVFRRGTGKTMHQYRSELRLRYAIGALERDELDLLTIALDTGYSGHSHFTAAFRRAFNVTPSRFRQDRKDRLTGDHLLDSILRLKVRS